MKSMRFFLFRGPRTNLFLALVTLSVAVFTSCTPPSSIPISLLAHNDYPSEDQYWSRGSLTLVSSLAESQVSVSSEIVADRSTQELDITVFVRNMSQGRYEVGENNIKVNIFFFTSPDVNNKSECYSNSLDMDADPKILNSLIGHEKLVIAPKISAREYMLTKEREHRLEEIVSSVATAINANFNYDSDVAEAITLESAGNRAERKKQQVNDLLASLSEGLFQRHTLWPGKSYMGIVKAPIPTTFENWRGIKTSLPTPQLIQVCANFGDDKHTFLFSIDKDIP